MCNSHPKILSAFLSAVISLVAPTTLLADDIFLTAFDGDWEVVLVETSDFDPEFVDQSGLTNWFYFDETFGVGHLYEQRSIYRVGSGTVAQPVITLTVNSANDSDTDPALDHNQMEVSYGAAGVDPIRVDVFYTLTGASAGSSTIQKDITITNISDSPIDVSWFEYADLDIDFDSFDLATNLTETLLGAKDSITQSDASTIEMRVNSGPNPDHYDIRPFDEVLSDILTIDDHMLGDSFPSLINDDHTFAMQWDINALASSESVTIGVALEGSFVEVPGLSEGMPIFPDTGGGGSFEFEDVRSGRWIDPPTAFGYEYTMDSASVFTAILGLPSGFDGPFEVVVDGIVLGTFGPGDILIFADFTEIAGSLVEGEFGLEGVSSFIVRGISPLTDPEDPAAFPIQLAFDTLTADLTMTALVPEPATTCFILCTSCVYMMRGGRRRIC